MRNTVELFAPPEYWQLTPTEKAGYVNGCGPKSIEFMVPDHLLFLDITEACNIHDFYYAIGTSLQEKEEGDRVFLNNMIRMIDAAVRPRYIPPLLWMRVRKRRMQLAGMYYTAVSRFGGPAFWHGKNKPEELSLVSILN